MNKKYILYLLVFFFGSSKAPAQNSNLTLEWVKCISNPKTISGVNNTATLKVNSAGEVYTAGCFFDTLDFDPGPAVYHLSGSMFIQKLDPSGNLIWAKSLQASGRIRSFTIDKNGNVYLIGNYGYTSDFDPGPAIANLNYQGGGSDIFILKLDASGNFVWAVSMGGFNDDVGISIAVDAVGNVYNCGYFSQQADFDPGPAQFNLSTPNSSFYIQKLDASGNFIWAKSMEFGDIFSYMDYLLAIDAKGNIYSTGRFDGTADFDPGTGVYNLSVMGFGTDVFIQKLDAYGNFIWAKSIAGTQLEVCKAIALDANNNFCATGFFQGTVDFDPGPGQASFTAHWTNAFIQKLDESGNFLWAKKMGKDSTTLIPCGMDIDTNQAIYTTGFFYGTSDFDPGAGIVNLSNGMYVQCLDASGNFNWARSMGNRNNTTYPGSIVLDVNNAIYISGVFSDTVDFDLESGVHQLISKSSSDIFIEKIDHCIAGNFSLGNDTTLCEGSSLMLSAAATKGNHLWQDNSTDSVFIAQWPGTYWVTTSTGACKISDTLLLNFDRPIHLDLGKDTNLCIGEKFRLHATGSHAIYHWQNGSVDSVLWVANTGVYRVEASNSCGIDVDEVALNFYDCDALFLPNSFTPNGDGLNDVFSPISLRELSEFLLLIFDRWGNMVYKSSELAYSWDGRYKGSEAPSGVYTVKLNYRFKNAQSLENKTGMITLIR